jgi:hypothetical protein
MHGWHVREEIGQKESWQISLHFILATKIKIFYISFVFLLILFIVIFKKSFKLKVGASNNYLAMIF